MDIQKGIAIVIVLISLILFILISVYMPTLYRFIFFRRSNFTKMGHSAQMRLIHQLNEACVEMSSKKIGALITIERKAQLDHLRTDGIILDASISSSLLVSIFNKYSPLHDGAVIIKNSRIKYAGTFYKITQSSVSNRYGARHRAAMGISEQSDALTIIISEETGGVSFTYEGKMIRVNIAEFQEKLVEYLK